MGMTETVRRRAANSAVLILRSARSEEIPQNRNKRARVSKDEDGHTPSCLETPRHRAWKRRVNALEARLLGMRGRRARRMGPSCFETPRCARLLSMRTITIARAEPRAKPGLWKFAVLVVFGPVIDGRLFFSCYLQGNSGPRASPSHVADAAVHHYL